MLVSEKFDFYCGLLIIFQVCTGEKKSNLKTVVMQAFAELEPDTPGTIHGLTYALGGKKMVMSDPTGLVSAVRCVQLCFMSSSVLRIRNDLFIIIACLQLISYLFFCRESLEDEVAKTEKN